MRTTTLVSLAAAAVTLAAFASLAGGCGGSSSATPSPVDARGDSAASSDAGVDADAGGGDAGTGDAPDALGPPAACPAGSACNARLLDDGRCPAACIAQSYAPHCLGAAFQGMCLGAGEPPATGAPAVEGDGVRVEAPRFPAAAAVGETHAFELAVTNLRAAPVDTVARLTAFPSWEIAVAPPGGPAPPLSLAPGERRVIALELRAVAANATGFEQTALRLELDGVALPRRGFNVALPVFGGAGDGLCGGHRLPATLPPGPSGGGYSTSRCCGDVFYPGADCCADADCAGGARCADGKCMAEAPRILYAGAPLGGAQRVLVVGLDVPPVAGGGAGTGGGVDLCADEAAARREALGLGETESAFAAITAARAGRADHVRWRWTVLAGLRAQQLGVDVPAVAEAGDLPALEAAVEAKLAAAGCLRSFAEDFDRVILWMPNVSVYSGGLVYAVDRVAVSDWLPLKTTHELGHTFGATDLYNDAGGDFQYAGALMTMSHRTGRDDVLWAEAGLGDLDGDGVLDAFQWSFAPESLEIATLEAFVDAAQVRFYLRLAGREGARTAKVLPRAVTLELPDAGVSVALTLLNHRAAEGARTRFQTQLAGGVVDLESLRQAGQVRVRVRAAAHVTAPDFTRRALSLDQTVTVPVTVTPPHI